MSGLKKHHINEVMDMHNLTRGEMGYSIVYYADDADKVIAELKKACNDKDNWCLHTLKEIRHHKYKRCLGMTRWCGNAYDKWMMKKANAIGLGKDGVEYYRQARWKVSHYMRWHKRWLGLAEKFKEAK